MEPEERLSKDLFIDVKEQNLKYSGKVINGNLHDDMAEYLAVADALITDYSGSVFDFALTGKPGFLYTPDKDHYINDERGVYLELEQLPYDSAIDDEKYADLEKRARAELSTPDVRRARLKKALAMKGTISAMEAHSGITGLIVENTIVEEEVSC